MFIEMDVDCQIGVMFFLDLIFDEVEREFFCDEVCVWFEYNVFVFEVFNFLRQGNLDIQEEFDCYCVWNEVKVVVGWFGIYWLEYCGGCGLMCVYIVFYEQEEFVFFVFCGSYLNVGWLFVVLMLMYYVFEEVQVEFFFCIFIVEDFWC